MALGLLLAGRAADRGGRPLDLLTAAAAFFADACKGALSGTAIDRHGGRPRLSLRLHPAEEDAQIVAAGDGRIVVAAKTTGAGPGYHRYLCEAIHRFGGALDIRWAATDLDEGIGDPTAYFDGGDARRVDEAMLAWLRGEAANARALASRGILAQSLSLAEAYEFADAGAIATPMGPRSLDWLEAVAADPARGIDVFPWWEDGLSARVRLGRAMCRLWTEVRWRAPLHDRERDLLRAIADELAGAWREDPTLAYPWSAWREVLAYLGQGGTVAEEVRRRAELEAPGPAIGYRRGDVRVRLADGWSIRIPGSLAESHEPDGTWSAWDHRRRVRVVSVESQGDEGMPAAEELLDASAREGDGRIERRGGVRGRASIRAAGHGSELTSLSAVPGRVAICNIGFDDEDDREWAIETWRSLEHPGGALH